MARVYTCVGKHSMHYISLILSLSKNNRVSLSGRTTDYILMYNEGHADYSTYRRCHTKSAYTHIPTCTTLQRPFKHTAGGAVRQNSVFFLSQVVCPLPVHSSRQPRCTHMFRVYTMYFCTHVIVSTVYLPPDTAKIENVRQTTSPCMQALSL